MSKWYNKSIEVVTKKNFIAVLLYINSLAFYIIQKIGDSEKAKIIGIFSFSMGMGQSLGERNGLKRKRDLVIIFLFLIAIFFYIIHNYIKYGEVIVMISIGLLLGEQMGFQIGRMRAKRQIN